MLGQIILTSVSLVALVAAAPAPAPQVSGYTDADAPVEQTPSPIGSLATVFGPDSQVSAIATSGPVAPLVSSIFTGPTSHGPYDGTPTTTGAVSTIVLASSIPAGPPNPTATYYNAGGKLLNAQPAPYTPSGMNSSFPARDFVLTFYRRPWYQRQSPTVHGRE